MLRNPGQMAPDPAQRMCAGGKGDNTGFALLTAAVFLSPALERGCLI